MNQLMACHGVQQELTDQEMLWMESGRIVKRGVLAQVMMDASGIYSMQMENASMKGEQQLWKEKLKVGHKLFSWIGHLLTRRKLQCVHWSLIKYVC